MSHFIYLLGVQINSNCHFFNTIYAFSRLSKLWIVLISFTFLRFLALLPLEFFFDRAHLIDTFIDVPLIISVEAQLLLKWVQ